MKNKAAQTVNILSERGTSGIGRSPCCLQGLSGQLFTGCLVIKVITGMFKSYLNVNSKIELKVYVQDSFKLLVRSLVTPILI